MAMSQSPEKFITLDWTDADDMTVMDRTSQMCVKFTAYMNDETISNQEKQQMYKKMIEFTFSIVLSRLESKNIRGLLRSFYKLCGTKSNGYESTLCDTENLRFLESLLQAEVTSKCSILVATKMHSAMTSSDLAIDEERENIIKLLEKILEPEEGLQFFATTRMMWSISIFLFHCIQRYATSLLNHTDIPGGAESLAQQETKVLVCFRIINSFMSKKLSVIHQPLCGALFDGCGIASNFDSPDIAELVVRKLPNALLVCCASPIASRDIITQAGNTFVILNNISSGLCDRIDSTVITTTPSSGHLIHVLLSMIQHRSLTDTSSPTPSPCDCTALHSFSFSILLEKFWDLEAANPILPAKNSIHYTIQSLLRAIVIHLPTYIHDYLRFISSYIISHIRASTTTSNKIYAIQTLTVFISKVGTVFFADASRGDYLERILDVIFYNIMSMETHINHSAIDAWHEMLKLKHLDTAFYKSLLDFLYTFFHPSGVNREREGSDYTTNERTYNQLLANFVSQIPVASMIEIVQDYTIFDIIDQWSNSVLCNSALNVFSSYLRQVKKSSLSTQELEERENQWFFYMAKKLATIQCANAIQNVINQLEKLFVHFPARLLNMVPRQSHEWSLLEALLLASAKSNGYTKWITHEDVTRWELGVYNSPNKKDSTGGSSKRDNGSPAIVYSVTYKRLFYGLCHHDTNIMHQLLLVLVNNTSSKELPCLAECRLLQLITTDEMLTRDEEYKCMIHTVMKKFFFRMRDGSKFLADMTDLQDVKDVLFLDDYSACRAEVQKVVSNPINKALLPEIKATYLFLKNYHEKLMHILQHQNLSSDNLSIILSILDLIYVLFSPKGEGVSPVDSRSVRGNFLGDALGFFSSHYRKVFLQFLNSSWEFVKQTSIKILHRFKSAICDVSVDSVLREEDKIAKEYLSVLDSTLENLFSTKKKKYGYGLNWMVLLFDTISISDRKTYAEIFRDNFTVHSHQQRKNAVMRCCNMVHPSLGIVFRFLIEKLGIKDLRPYQEQINRNHENATIALELYHQLYDNNNAMLALLEAYTDMSNESEEISSTVSLLAQGFWISLFIQCITVRTLQVNNEPMSINVRDYCIHGLVMCVSSFLNSALPLLESEKLVTISERLNIKDKAMGEAVYPYWSKLILSLPHIFFFTCSSMFGLIAEHADVLLNPIARAQKEGITSEEIQEPVETEKNTHKIDCRGHLIADGEQVEDSSITICAWITVREVGISLNSVMAYYPLHIDDIERLDHLGVKIISFLLSTRHPGAMDKLYSAFTVIIKKLLSSNNTQFCRLPFHWTTLLLQLVSPHSLLPSIALTPNTTLALPPALRRSISLGLAFVSICRGETGKVTNKSSTLLEYIMTTMIGHISTILDATAKSDEESDSTLQEGLDDRLVHILNIIRSIIRDAKLTQQTNEYALHITSISIATINHSNWKVRNASNLLLSACMKRMFASEFDVKLSNPKGFTFCSGIESRSTMARCNQMALTTLISSATDIYNNLIQLLSNPTTVVGDESSIVASLLLLTRSVPTLRMFATIEADRANSLLVQQCIHIFKHQIQCLSHWSFFVRSFAARSLAQYAIQEVLANASDKLDYALELGGSVRSPTGENSAVLSKQQQSHLMCRRLCSILDLVLLESPPIHPTYHGENRDNAYSTGNLAQGVLMFGLETLLNTQVKDMMSRSSRGENHPLVQNLCQKQDGDMYQTEDGHIVAGRYWMDEMMNRVLMICKATRFSSPVLCLAIQFMDALTHFGVMTPSFIHNAKRICRYIMEEQEEKWDDARVPAVISSQRLWMTLMALDGESLEYTPLNVLLASESMRTMRKLLERYSNDKILFVAQSLMKRMISSQEVEDIHNDKYSIKLLTHGLHLLMERKDENCGNYLAEELQNIDGVFSWVQGVQKKYENYTKMRVFTTHCVLTLVRFRRYLGFGGEERVYREMVCDSIYSLAHPNNDALTRIATASILDHVLRVVPLETLLDVTIADEEKKEYLAKMLCSIVTLLLDERFEIRGTVVEQVTPHIRFLLDGGSLLNASFVARLLIQYVARANTKVFHHCVGMRLRFISEELLLAIRAETLELKNVSDEDAVVLVFEREPANIQYEPLSELAWWLRAVHYVGGKEIFTSGDFSINGIVGTANCVIVELEKKFKYSRNISYFELSENQFVGFKVILFVADYLSIVKGSSNEEQKLRIECEKMLILENCPCASMLLEELNSNAK